MITFDFGQSRVGNMNMSPTIINDEFVEIKKAEQRYPSTVDQIQFITKLDSHDCDFGAFELQFPENTVFGK